MPKREPRPKRLTVVHYHDAAGRRCAKGDAGAVATRARTDTYYADLFIDQKRRRVSLGTTDEGQAWVELRRLQKRAFEQQRGLRDHFTDAADKPLAAHLDDWLAAVRDGGATAKHCGQMRKSVEWVSSRRQWTRLGDVAPEGVLAALAELQRPTGDRPRDKGRSAQTRNHYLSHCKQFCRWCVETKRLRDNPLVGLGPLNVAQDRRHDRRSPTGEEVALLFTYLESERAEERCDMSGLQRAAGYRLCMATGYRAGELRSLKRENFDLQARTVQVAGWKAKNRKRQVQPLPEWIIDELKAWLRPGQDLWEKFPLNHPGELLRLDLEEAGVQYSVPGPDGPLFFDFHALRYFYITALANQPGISPKSLMELARHSDPRLTMKVYAKSHTADMREAVNNIAPPGAVSKRE
jgi:integrase